MLNSIFKKALFLLIIISLINLLLTSFLIGSLLEKLTFEKSKDSIVKQAYIIENSIYDFIDGNLSKEKLKKRIENFEENTKINVSIITDNNNVAFLDDDPQIRDWVIENYNTSKSIVGIKYQKNDNLKMLIVGKPLHAKGSQVGMVFLHSPLQETTTIIKDIYKIISVSVLIMILPIFIISFFAIRTFTKPIIDMNHTVKGISNGFFNDRVRVNTNDELHSLANSINDMAEKIDKIEESRRKFISEISHELRTPLTSIRVSLQGIYDGVIKEEDKDDFLEISLSEISRLSVLIEELIELSAFEEKSVVLQKENANVSIVLSDTITQLSPKAMKNNIEINGNIEPNANTLIDKNKLKQVFINLIDNAIKNSFKNSEVLVTLKNNNNYIIIDFKNHSGTIDKENVKHVFNRFYKTDYSRNEKGYGLGLTISKHIIDLHGGDIYVTIEKNNLITFSIKLKKI